MHIRRVQIENVRRFGSGTAGVDLTLPPRGWIVIAGPNGSGKTTFLQVIALALSPVLHYDFADAMFSWLRRGVTNAKSRLTLVPSSEDKIKRRVDLDISSTKRAEEEFEIGDDWGRVNDWTDHSRVGEGNRALAGPWHSEPDGWFAVGYGAHRRLVGHASLTENWASGTTREGAFLTLFRDDASLVHPIRWLMDLDYRRLDSQVSQLERTKAKHLVDGVLSLLNDGLLGDTKVLGVDSRGLSVQQGDQQLSIFNLGAGAQILAAFVVDLLRHMHARFGALHFSQHQQRPIVKHEGVVLIDEVEAHLHPAWQRALGVWLCKHFPNVQFIVTTHSPFVCQSASEGGLILLPAPGSPEPVRIADADVYHKAVNGSVDEALLSGLFGLEHTWSESAEKKRERLAALEARVLTGKAKPAEREEYRGLLAEIPQTMSDEVERVAARLSSSGAISAQKR
jgi:energy-coupling factor transporter ATP-binding protein EcfA2